MYNFDEFMKINKRPIPDDSVLAIVCNAKTVTTMHKNYGSFSIDTEFLSDNELKEIMQMAAAQNLPFRIFYDEKEFINLLLTTDINVKKLIVYNSAQNGIGPGRKALIPSLCKYFNIRYTGSDPYRVCLCRDKYGVYSILTMAGLPTAKSILFSGDCEIKLEQNIKYIAKPIYESSSIGITDNNIFLGKNLPYTYLKKLINTLKQPLIIQRFISGYEIEIPILVGMNSRFVFPPVVLYRGENIIIGNEILDYKRIYNDDYHFTNLPSIYDDLALRNTAESVAKLLGLNGLCRVDFRLTSNGEYFITDVSTNPHFIHHSSVNYAFKRLGLSDKDIFNAILNLS